MRTELFLAWRYFKPKRNAVSIITLISVIGVGLGVGVLVVVLAVMTGFTDKMKGKLLDTTAHAQIYPIPQGASIRKPGEIVKVIQASGGDAVPIASMPVILQKGERFVPKMAIGFEPESDTGGRVKLKDNISYGSFSLERGQVVVGEYVAGEMSLRLGDKLLIHSQNRLNKLMKLVKQDKDGKIEVADNAQVYLPAEFTVSGISSFGKSDFDKQFVFMNLDDADDLFGLPWGSATCVYAWTQDPFKMRDFMAQLREKLPDYSCYSWMQMNSRWLDVLAVEKNMQFFLLFFIVLVSAFSITNTLITTVIGKTREIGLLKAMGSSSWSVMSIFLLQGLFVGLIGTGFGIGLGFLVVLFRMKILMTLRYVTGMEIFPPEFYFFKELPAEIVPTDVLWISVISITLCTIGGIVPALRAASLDPAKALKDE